MLGGVSPDQVSRIVREAGSAGRSPLPSSSDPELRARAMGIVEARGIRDRLARKLTPTKPIEVLPYSRLRELRRTGSREGYESLFYAPSAQIELAALACWLGMDCRDYLHDLLWAQCETDSWVMPCSVAPRQPIDLWAAMMARWLGNSVTDLFGAGHAGENRGSGLGLLITTMHAEAEGVPVGSHPTDAPWRFVATVTGSRPHGLAFATESCTQSRTERKQLGRLDPFPCASDGRRP